MPEPLTRYYYLENTNEAQSISIVKPALPHDQYAHPEFTYQKHLFFDELILAW